MRPSEQQVLIEKVFIDATCEKILGNYEQAAYLFSEVTRKDENNHAAHYELAQLFEKLERRDRALEKAKIAVNLAPDNVMYTQLYADFLAKNGAFKDAAEAYEELLEFHPVDPALYTKQAEYLIKAQRTDLAIRVYNLQEKRMGVQVSSSLRKFALYKQEGKSNKAIKELEAFIRVHPKHIQVHEQLADYLEAIGKPTKALEVYERILRTDPQNLRANLALVEHYRNSGDESRYLNALVAIFKDEAREVDAKVKLLSPFVQRMEDASLSEISQKAVDLLANSLVQTHPNSIDAQHVYANYLFFKKEYRQALSTYETLLNLDKNQFEVWTRALFSANQLERVDKLKKLSGEAVELYPNQGLFMFYLAKSSFLSGAYQEALQQLERTELMAGEQLDLQAEVYCLRGRTFAKLHREDMAYQAFDEALAIQPDHLQTLSAYSALLANQSENWGKALKLAEKAIQQAPKNLDIQGNYAWILYQQKNYKESRRWFEQALSNGGDRSPLILERYGDVLYHLDETDIAVEYWQRALNSGSTSEVLPQKVKTRHLYD